MVYKIDRFKFSDETIQNFDRVGITPKDVQFWIEDGRKNNVPDEGIQRFITDKYNELNKTEEKQRGRNLGGALRFVAQQVPIIGSRTDELEANIRADEQGVKDYLASLSEEEKQKMRADKDYAVKKIKERPESFREEAYQKMLKNARESYQGAERAFYENTAKGNWFDRNIGKYAPAGIAIAGNVPITVATGGANLLPSVSALQGAIDWSGQGEDAEQKAILGGIGGGLSYILPAGLNKLFPTKSVTQSTVNKYASGKLLGAKNPYETVVAKTIKTGEEPVAVIAKESTRGTEPAILKNLQKALKGNDAQAKLVYDSAVKNVDYARNAGGFTKYIKDRLPKNLSEKVSDNLSKGFAKLEDLFEGVSANGDILVKENLPNMIDSVINEVMRGASATERSAVKSAATKAFAERHISKEISKKLIPQDMIGNIGNQASMIRPDRIITRPVSNLLNRGTLNTLQGKSIIGKQPSDVARTIVDALLKQGVQ